MFKIKFYRDSNGREPIVEYLEELNAKAKTSKHERVELSKVVEYMKILSEFGTRAGEPYVKYIGEDVWELRPLDNRVFFFYFRDNTFVMLHHFKKKTRKTPRREIDRALRNMREVLERSEDYE